MTGRASPPAQRGFALLIVLWSVVLLALLATGITAAGRSDVQLATNIRRAAAAQQAADAGIAMAVFHVSDAPAQAWLADGSTRRVPFGAYTLTVRIADEARKINPNFVPPDLLAALLTGVGADPRRAAELGQAISDWHVPGSRDVMVARYRAAGMAAAPTGTLFRSIDELGLVIGMTPDLLAGLRPHLSVYAQGPLNFEQADPVIREAVQRLGGLPPPQPTGRPSVIDVTSDARSRDGSRFVRHAVVALGKDDAGRLFRTLLWEAAPAS